MAAERAGIATGFINKRIEIDGTERRYVVYVPRQYDPEKKWPLILFLHGAGERGNDGLLQTEVGIGRAIRKHADWFPCLVLMPQCPERMWWDGARKDVEQTLEKTLREYNIDPDRVYLTGLSMGGYACWMYGAEHAEKFAALMPICGGGREKDASSLATLPIWAFHGASDDVVSPEESRKMVKAVRDAGGNIQYTEFEDTGHNSWDKAYGEEKHIKWLLQQRRQRPPRQ
jgi:predicted peptidase